MNYRDKVKLLKEAGFSFERRGTRHEIWTKGLEKIAISPMNRMSPCTLASFKSRMRKHIKNDRQAYGN
jgi:hypothetical protein